MKIIKKLSAGLVLALALASTAAAGEMSTPGIMGDIGTPGVMGDIDTPAAQGDMPAPGVRGDMAGPGATATSADSFTAFALWLLGLFTPGS